MARYVPRHLAPAPTPPATWRAALWASVAFAAACWADTLARALEATR